jgi:major type 1 subunit fimbrin (pilin)
MKTLPPLRLLAGALFVLTAATTAHAASSTDGTVNFTGNIVEIPCTISGDGGNIAVDMQTVSSGAVLDGAPKVPFSIKLSDCSIAIKKTVQVKFSGNTVGQGLLALTAGTGKDAPAPNVAIKLYQKDEALPIGTQSTAVNLSQGDSEIPFSAQYVSYGGQPGSGNGAAVAQFTLTYQ